MESHTTEQIETANKARVHLRRLAKGKPSEVKKWPKIVDERHVKQPIRPYPQFVSNRYASGDFKNMEFKNSVKLIAQEWKALTPEEKKASRPVSAS